MISTHYLPKAACNGRVVPLEEAKVPAVSDGFMFGSGLFETIRVDGGLLCRFEEHLARISRSAWMLGYAFDGDADRLRNLCEAVVTANGLEKGSLKLIVFEMAEGASEIVLARPGLYPAETYVRGFKLTIETVAGRPSLAGHKTLNYLENIAAKRRALARGFDEAVFSDLTGEVFEGATTNLFVVKEGRVFTPPADGKILPGIVRDRVLQLLGARALQAPVSWKRLREADEVFVTNALLGVMPVAEIDGFGFDLTRNPLTKSLMAEVNG